MRLSVESLELFEWVFRDLPVHSLPNAIPDLAFTVWALDHPDESIEHKTELRRKFEFVQRRVRRKAELAEQHSLPHLFCVVEVEVLADGAFDWLPGVVVEATRNVEFRMFDLVVKSPLLGKMASDHQMHESLLLRAAEDIVK